MEPGPATSPPGTRTLLQEMYQHWPPQLLAPGDTLDRLRAAEPAPATSAGHRPARRRTGRGPLAPARR